MSLTGHGWRHVQHLTREEEAYPEPRPPVLIDLNSHPLLAGTKLIAETWDASCLF